MTKRNKKLAESFRNLPCVVCGSSGEGDHILNFKRISNRNQLWNLWSLCRMHHHEKTHYGLTRFVNKYGLKLKLIKLGFEFCDYNNRWIHKNDK